jgi:UDP-3-O-[3-hydroxymyristoyl] glucosamine N-acyltransferase
MNNIKLKNKVFITNLNKMIKINSKYFGAKNTFIDNFSSIKKNYRNSLSFIENEEDLEINKINGTVILKKKNKQIKSQIITSDPRFFFVRVINFLLKDKVDLIHYPNVNYRDKNNNTFNKKKITCCKNAFIGKNVSIGKNSYIGKNTIIYPNCTIGKNVKILDNVVIGCYGLGYLKKKLLMPHLGSVIIEDNVSIGANCTIVRGTLDHTKIGKNVKIANNVNIGHNVSLKSNCLVSSSVSIAGGAQINKNTILGLGAKIKNNIMIGKNSQVGIGSVVVKNLKTNSTVFGNPSRSIRLDKKIL